jgi:hypothetical protein
MPRKRGPGKEWSDVHKWQIHYDVPNTIFVPEGKPKHYAVPPEQMIKQEAFVHSNPPKGNEWFKISFI